MDFTETVTLVVFLSIAFGCVYFFNRDPKVTLKRVLDYFDHRPAFVVKYERETLYAVFYHGQQFAVISDTSVYIQSGSYAHAFIFGKDRFESFTNAICGIL